MRKTTISQGTWLAWYAVCLHSCLSWATGLGVAVPNNSTVASDCTMNGGFRFGLDSATVVRKRRRALICPILMLMLGLAESGAEGASPKRGPTIRMSAFARGAGHLAAAMYHQLRHWATSRTAMPKLRRAIKQLDRIERPPNANVKFWTNSREMEYHHLRRAGRQFKIADQIPLAKLAKGFAVTGARKRHAEVLWDSAQLTTSPQSSGLAGSSGFAAWYKGNPRIGINLDSRAARRDPNFMLNVYAHERRHIAWESLARARLEQLFDKSQRPGTAPELKARIEDEMREFLKYVRDRANGETDAIGDEAYSVALVGKPWTERTFRKPSRAYPPERMNNAAIDNYIAGVAEYFKKAYRSAAESQKKLAAAYLRGYEDHMRAMADHAVKSYTPPSPAQPAIDAEGVARRPSRQSREWIALGRRTFVKTRRSLDQRFRSNLTLEAAYDAGRWDADLRLAPHTRLKTILSDRASRALDGERDTVGEK